MKRLMFAVFVVATITCMLAETSKKKIIAVTPLQVRWFTPSYYTDGRERAQLLGDSSQGGAWVDRVKMPAGKRVLAHTHPQDEVITVIHGTWYLGEGMKFNNRISERIPRGQFHRRPCRRTSFCGGGGRPRNHSTQRKWQVSHGLS